MAGKGGKRAGAGRKPKAQEELANTRILSALRTLYKKDADEENINLFLVDFIPTGRGQQFIAEHLLGKPKEIKETTITSVENTPVIVFGTGE